MSKKISIFGLGYIGLPTAAMFAAKGHQVIGVDIDKAIIESINKGIVHIFEPKLDELVKTVVASKNLFAQSYAEPSDAFIIAVPTPFTETKDNINPKPDVSFINNVIESIAPVLDEGNLIILESTSPVGTTEEISKKLSKLRKDLLFPHSHGDNANIKIAYCPERVLPGNIINELQFNDRVIGGISSSCSKKAKELYEIFVKANSFLTNSKTAEMVKLTENSFRDVNIAFANELSIISDSLDIDVWELIRLANKHPRVNILDPGPGVGGHCIAVDPWFIVDKCPDESKLILTARQVNDNKPKWVSEKVVKEINKYKKNSNKENISVALLGISYKANIDDLRESPALEIAQSLTKLEGLEILIVEPNINYLPKEIAKFASLVSTEDAIKDAEIIVSLVDHDEFKAIKNSIEDSKSVIDIKGLWNDEK